ncbi:hypothetical protein H6768_03370 [Candidatus Peribacteria bacterium]|nr:hypothetical protein [Candidatus Peribacteria bacterium]
MSTFLILLVVFFFSLTFIAYRKIVSYKGKIHFTYTWAALMGGFVWEDVLIFSIYGGISSILTLLFRDYRLGILFFLVFWIVRSAGETLYFFLQQFIEPKHDPHAIDNHFVLLRKVFQTLSYQQCLIIMQITFQSIMMFSIAGLILLLKFW